MDCVKPMWAYQYKHGDRPLEGYTIQHAAGRGGFGEVYYAISDSGREVALKVVTTYEQIELRHQPVHEPQEPAPGQHLRPQAQRARPPICDHGIRLGSQPAATNR